MPEDIRILVIPADVLENMGYRTINPTDLEAMQALVGGHLETIELRRPPAFMMVNEDAHTLNLMPNIRATNIVLAHAHVLLNSPILGDCFITGPVDDDSWQSSVPDFWGKVV
jgi:hypothetical protein